MKLEQVEIDSTAWKRLKVEIEERIEKHRTQLEKDRPELETAVLRGQVKALRSLLLVGDLKSPD